ncbi:MAG: cadmium-translocating P-type ATPase [Hyphomicrobiaceae bacterium]|nr:cadmium-translocating P-type ATPase [Hyphomicrobiaceae bacterium]
MHCGACMRKVENALSALPGVTAARANLSSKRVSVVALDGKRNAEVYIETLSGLGFTASLLPDSAAQQTSRTSFDIWKRVGVAGFAAANIMLLSVSVWSGHSGEMPHSVQGLFHWLSALIALPTVAYAGRPFFVSAREAIRNGRLNMDVPISVGVLLATGMSLFQTMRGSEQVYFDAAVTLLFFLLIGRALDQFVRTRAAGAAENLLGIRAPAASVLLPDGSIERIATSEILPGMRLIVAAGERVPVDGRVYKAKSDIDESLLTGESLPRTVATGDTIFCGTLNLTSPIEIEATTVAENTLLAEIAQLMTTAEQAKGRYVRLADRAAQIYAPAVHILGLLTFVGWMLAGYNWEPALTAAIAVLIITCPCALALAVPAVQVVATGRLMQAGIILKSADGLERLSEVDTVVFDKTGTLTLGEPRLATDSPVKDHDLAIAAGLASRSRHPYSRAVVIAARSHGLTPRIVENVQEIAGEGLTAIVDGTQVRLGSASYCGYGGQPIQGLYFRWGSDAPVPLAMLDRLRSDAIDTLGVLRSQGFNLHILSGDQRDSVASAAAATGISYWMAAQKPDDKIREIERLSRVGKKVLMVGDGLNDAPALAAGHASLSPSTAADISQVAADAIFQGERLRPILELLEVAKLTKRRSLENFTIAIGYNLVFVPLAMLGYVTPLIAAIAMSGSSIAVTLNALRMSNPRRGVHS